MRFREGRGGQEELKRSREGWRESEGVGEVQGVLERTNEGRKVTGSVREGQGVLRPRPHLDPT